MSEITFELVTEGYDKLDEIEKIYEEAFPENEREASIDTFVNASTHSDIIGITAAIDKGRIAGIVILMEKPEYAFMFYLAVNNEIRGKGYGSRIMEALLDYYSDRPVIFDIETPLKAASNYEQRVKRQAFYERLGCIRTDIVLEYGEDSYTFYTSKNSDNLKDHIRDYMKTCKSAKDQYSDAEIIPGVDQLTAFLEEL